jgi:hypothetical protein
MTRVRLTGKGGKESDETRDTGHPAVVATARD